MTCTKQGGGCGAYVRCCIERRIHVEAVALAVSPAWVLVEAEADSEAFKGKQEAAQKRRGEVLLHVGLHLGDESIHVLLVAARRRVLALAAAPPGAHRDNIFAFVRGLVRAEPEWRYVVVSRTGSATKSRQSYMLMKTRAPGRLARIAFACLAHCGKSHMCLNACLSGLAQLQLAHAGSSLLRFVLQVVSMH